MNDTATAKTHITNDSNQQQTNPSESFWQRIEGNGLLLLWVLCLILFVPMALHWRDIGDFEAHNLLASYVATNPDDLFSDIPHFLYHVLTGVPYALVPSIGVATWGAMVMVASYLLTGAVLLYAIRQRVQKLSWWALLGSVGIVLALMVAVPINLFTPENLYFGYFSNNVYHNPTVNLMKPFAILLFLGLARLYDASWQPRHVGARVVGYALLSITSLMAKPSFIIAILPALGLLTLYRMLRRQTIHWVVLLGGVVIPTGALLFYQIFVMTGAGTGGAIRIEPLRVFFEWTLHYEQYANVGLIEKLLLSIAFPLLVYGLYWRKTTRHLLFNLAWMMLGVALAYSYLLVDDTQIAAGDFIWSAQTAVVMLFVVATLTLVTENRALFETRPTLNSLRQHGRLWLSLALLGVHLVAGIHWYYMHITEPYVELIFRWW
jgi:hypothetical protein